MKLYLKALLLAACSTAMLSADFDDDLQVIYEASQDEQAHEVPSDESAEREPQADEVPQIIMPFSQERAEAYKLALIEEEHKRFKYQILAGTGIALAGSYALYRAGRGIYDWWQEDKLDADDTSKPVRVRLKRRREEIKAIAKKLLKLEKSVDKYRNPTYDTWGGWLWGKTKGFAEGVGRLVPRWAGNIASVIVVAQGYRIAKKVLPDVGDYLFEGRTIGWYIETQTTLRKSVRDVAHWADDVANINRDNEVQCLSASMSVFVEQVEKVMGYMLFVKDQLTQEQDREITRAQVCSNTIKKILTEIIKESNAIITGERKLEGDYRTEFATFVKTGLRALISQMEKFEVVQQALGYDNLERTSTFDNLRAELIAEVKKLRSEVKEFKQLLAQLRAHVASQG